MLSNAEEKSRTACREGWAESVRKVRASPVLVGGDGNGARTFFVRPGERIPGEALHPSELGLCSVPAMAPLAFQADFLDKVPGVSRGTREIQPEAPRVLVLGNADLDSVLPDGGLPKGSVTELSVEGGAALTTSLSLLACRAAAEEAIRQGGEAPWCAFIDPSRTLHGPGVRSHGVDPSRLLVVRPPIEALERTAIRLVESHAFAVVVVDSVGTPGALISVSLASWPRVVRRLALAAEESGACVIVITDGELPRASPLPVALRLELRRTSEDRLTVRVAKDRRGRVSESHTLRLGKSRAKGLRSTLPGAASVAVARHD